MFRSKLGARRGWIAGAGEEWIATGQDWADTRHDGTAPPGSGRLTRRQLLRGAGGAAGLAALGGAAFKPLASGQWATNVSVAQYRGEAVLIWWEGEVASGYGQGEGVIVDSSYRELARVRAGGGRQVDLHEFRLTPEGTALFTCHPDDVQVDLSSIGGPSDATVRQSIIQEIEVHSGRVLLEWRSLEHIAVSESYQSPGGVYDYLHANSVDVTPNGNLLVSGRHTWALYKLERRTGQVIWRLGGKRSDFQMGKGVRFAWQHDARQPADDQITVFDDGAGPERTEPQSRGLVLDVDSSRRTVRLARGYQHPQALQAISMGSTQTLPDGHALVGWGSLPGVSEFAANGKLLADTRLGSGHQSYRTCRFPWTGSPTDAPAIATTRDAITGNSTLHVSWNGATEVARWQVRTGPSANRLRPLGLANRRGFETAIALATGAGYVAVTALSVSGRQLASSAAIRL